MESCTSFRCVFTLQSLKASRGHVLQQHGGQFLIQRVHRGHLKSLKCKHSLVSNGCNEKLAAFSLNDQAGGLFCFYLMSELNIWIKKKYNGTVVDVILNLQ